MILVIAEKPSVAAELAKVVGATKKETGYYSGNGYLVSWCVGHLVGLANPDAYDPALKAWSLDTLPIIPDKYKTTITEATTKQFYTLKELMHRSDVTELIEATDAGREGELIFRLVYDKAGCKKPFKRLWVSSKEESAIREAFDNMKPGSAYDNLYQAALCRQRADWLVGMNFTRLYSKTYDRKLTVGRVQTPTLAMIVSRQREIECFVPVPYYTISADLGGFTAHAKVDNERTANDIISRCRGKDAFVSKVERKETKNNPAALYDLTTLQREANRCLGYTAQQTLDILQSLYEKKLTTYPRTDSRFITHDMEHSMQSLISSLLAGDVVDGDTKATYDINYVSLSQVIDDKKVTDHHAILPTGSVTAAALEPLPPTEKALLLLIIYRLLSAVYVPHVYTATKAVFDIAGEPFVATGREVLDIGYKAITDRVKALIKNQEEPEPEPDAPESAMLPTLVEGALLPVLSIKSEAKQTRPPKPYDDYDLLGAMETAGNTIADGALRDVMKERGIGTAATRAGIIETLVKTGYVTREKKNIIPTEAALTFIDLVSEKVKSPQLTAEWESKLEAINNGELAATSFMSEIENYIRSFVGDSKMFFTPETVAGTFDNSRPERKSVGACPCCGKNVVEYPKSYSCEGGKDGCGFTIWREMAGKTITPTQATKLLKTGTSDVINGFKSKTTGTTFSARLTLGDGLKSPVFDFSGIDNKTKSVSPSTTTRTAMTRRSAR